MIETITAISLAYNGIKLAVNHADDAVHTVKKMMAVGHDIMDCYDELRTFFVAQGKVQVEEQKIEQAKKDTPEAFAEVDVTTQAFDIVMARRKMIEREKEIREWLIYSGNGDVYRELCAERAKIIGDREAIKAAEKAAAKKAAQAERRKRQRVINAITDGATLVVGGFVIAGLLYGIAWMIGMAITN